MHFYAIADHNGPISKRLNATALSSAILEFAEWEYQDDTPDTDFEDEFGFDGSEMDSVEFESRLELHGFKKSLDVNSNWSIWSADDASSYADSVAYPVVFMAGHGSPSGESIALLDGVELPFELCEVFGHVNDDVFECCNLTTGPGAYDWRFSDWNANIVYKIQVYSDRKVWESQHAELMECD